MEARTVILVFNCFIIVQICGAQVIQGGPKPTPATQTPGSNPVLPTPSASTTPATPSPFERMTPKCYPETATAYFLPAPPSSPKVTILDPKLKEEIFKEAPANLAANIISNRPSFTPPPAPSPIPVLPDLMNETPTLIQERFNSLAKSDRKVCDTCASLMEKLPIFKFDQELLNGFLAGLGL